METLSALWLLVIVSAYADTHRMSLEVVGAFVSEAVCEEALAGFDPLIERRLERSAVTNARSFCMPSRRLRGA